MLDDRKVSRAWGALRYGGLPVGPIAYRARAKERLLGARLAIRAVEVPPAWLL